MRTFRNFVSCTIIGIAILGTAGAQGQTPGVVSFYSGAIMQGAPIFPPANNQSYSWIQRVPQARGPDRYDAVYSSAEEGNWQTISYYVRGRIGNTIYIEGTCWWTSHGWMHGWGWISPTQMCIDCPNVFSGNPPYQNYAGANPWSALISNAGGVSGVTASSATLNGSLDSSGSDTPAVSVYWGAVDCGTNTVGWDHVVTLGTPAGLTTASGSITISGETFTPANAGLVGPLSTTVSGLTPGATYYYRFYGLNSGGVAWGDPAVQFKAASSPVVNNGAVTNIMANSATLTGNLTSGGNASVTVYWGTTDGGTTAASWQNSASLGALGEGAFSCTVTGLAPNAAYYSRCYAANVVGTGWSASTLAFQSLPSLTNGWECAMKITFSGYNRPETLTNFPALIVLNQGISGLQYSQFETPGGGDLRFMDANNVEIPYEMETWNPGGNSYVWVKVPQLANSSSYIWALWGLDKAKKPAYTTDGSAWPAGCSAVWHMNDANALDSSSNANKGTVSGSVNIVSSSLTGGALQFNSNGCVMVPDSPSLRPNTSLDTYFGFGPGGSDFSMSFWLQDDNGGTVLSRYEIAPNEYPWPAAYSTPFTTPAGYGVNDWTRTMFVNVPTRSSSYVNGSGWCLGTGFADGAAPGFISLPTGRPDSSSAWHYYAMTFSGTMVGSSQNTISYYRDGSLVGSVLVGGGARNWFAPGDADYLCLGADNRDGSAKLSGTLDEVRVENALRSANWIWACDMTMASNSVFTSYGAIIESPGKPHIGNLPATNITTTSVCLNGNLNTDGLVPTSVWVYMGVSGQTGGVDGTNKAQWQTSFFLGTNQAVGGKTVSATVVPNTTYYYRYYATNSYGDTWASDTATFMTGPIWVQATDPNASGRGSIDTGTFTVYRPATTTDNTMTVYCTVGGTAVPGVDYQPISSNITLAAGVASTSVIVTPVLNAWGTSNKTVTLTVNQNPGYIVQGSPSNSAVVTITYSDVAYTGPFKMKVMFSGYNQTGTLSNFPALVQFSDGMGGTDFDYRRYPFLSASGYDLRFYDSTGVTELPYEIEQWTNASSLAAYVWVRVPSIATSNDYIWAEWGNSSNTTQMAYTTNGAVWANGFSAVWHLDSNSPNVADSTSNHINGTPYSDLNAAGIVNGAQKFSGSAYVDFGNAPAPGSALTLEAWVSCTNGGPIMVRKPTSGAHELMGYDLEMGNQPSFNMHFDNSGNDHLALSGTGGFNDGNWHHVVGLWTGPAGTLYIYVDGIQRGSVGSGNVVYDGNDVNMGKDPFYFNCINNALFDEIRFSSVVRSSNWIWTTYMMIASNATFVSYGSLSGSGSGTPPSAPSGLTATAVGSSQINLAWTDNSTNESSFLIERSTGTDSSFAQVATVGANVTSYSDTGLVSSTAYYYRVRAANGFGNSGYSNEGSATTQAGPSVPAAPSGLTATVAGSNQISLAWTDNSTNETGFLIERSTSVDGSYVQIATVGANVTTYNDTGLTFGTLYYYRVRAANGIGNSGYSNEANGTTLGSSGGSGGPPYKMKISFSGYNRGETLANFPALIVFSNGMGGTSFAFTNCPFLSTKGYDLRFTDASQTTNLNYEIEQWTNAASAVAYVWVQVPAISSSNDCIWAKWADTNAVSQLPCTTNGAVWTSTYQGVWHLSGTNTSGQVTDSTVSNHVGTVGSAAVSTNGEIAGGWYFDAGNSGNNRITMGTSCFPAGGAVRTLSGWARSLTGNGSTGVATVFGYVGGGSDGDSFELDSSTDNKYYFVSGGTAISMFIDSLGTTWKYVSITWNGTYINAYLNGQQVITNSSPSKGINTASGAGMQLGFKTSQWGFGGAVDEVRIENVVRSSNWLWACWLNMASNPVFNSYQTQAGGGSSGPIAPSGLTATPVSSNQINLAWSDNSTNETGFLIERSTAVDGSYVQIGTVGANVTTYNDTGLTPSTVYYYRVRASGSAGNSGYSNEANATTQSVVTPPSPPAAPSGLTATAAGTNQINLAWTDNSTNETGFLIERKTGPGGTYVQIATVGVNATGYNDTGLTPSTVYYYRVRATNSVGDSGYCNEANATTQTPLTPPNAPSGLAATAAGSSQINLAWTDNSANETGFLIERSTGVDGSYVQIGTVGAGVTNYNDSGLSASTVYYYRVRATNSAGNSGYSNEGSATTTASVVAVDWPCYRGPNQDGSTAETIASWPPKEVWRANIGQGFSQVVVSQGKVYTMGWSNGLDYVYCFSASSAGVNPPVLWQASYPASPHGNNNDYGTRATPTLDGGQVYTYSCDGVLNCFDAATGHTNWSMMVTAGGVPTYGFCGSPLVEGSNVIVNAGGSGVAIDKSGTRTNWTSSGSAGYGSPYAVTVGTQRTVVVASSSACSGVDPVSGAVRWYFTSGGGLDPGSIDPIIYNNQLWVAQSQGAGCLVNLGSGALTGTVWQANLYCGDHCTVLYNGYLYGPSYYTYVYPIGFVGGGIQCVEFATGITKWNSSYTEFDGLSTVMRAGNQLVIMAGGSSSSSNGNLVVAQATPTGYQEVYRTNGILTGETWTCPTLSNGRLYVRNDTTTANMPATLICYDVSAGGGSASGIPPTNWINQYYPGTSNYASAASSDTDGDGMTAWQEYLAGTDPTNRNSRLSVSITNIAGQTIVTVSSIQATGANYTNLTRYYDIEQCTNLLTGATWQPASGYAGILGNGGIIACTNATQDQVKFYRARVRLQ